MGSEILNLLLCLGIRNSEFRNQNSESSTLLFGGSEIVNPLLCSWRIRNSDLVHSCVVWEIRNSESPMFLGIGNSEFSPVLFGGRNSESSKLFGDQKFWILPCVVWRFRNCESSPVFLENQKFWFSPLLCCLGDQKFWMPSRVFVKDEI